MAVSVTRHYEFRVVVTSEDAPAPAETYIDGGAVMGATEFAVDVQAVNPGGGEIAVAVEAATEYLVDVEGVTP